MARNETLVIPSTYWLELTANDITSATFQVTGAHDARLMGAVGQNIPIEPHDGVVYRSDMFDGETDRSLAELFPGISATRLYARALTGTTKIFISHT